VRSVVVIRFEVPGNAVAFATKNVVFVRGGRQIRGTRKTDAAADWQYEVQRCAAVAMNQVGAFLLEGPVQVSITCYFGLPSSRELKKSRRPQAWKDTKPDVDKIARLVLDALEGVAYANDSGVARLGIQKYTAAQGEPARTIVVVKGIEP
jgi:Holliday junction resolvase RusA-like endonuclease